MLMQSTLTLARDDFFGSGAFDPALLAAVEGFTDENVLYRFQSKLGLKATDAQQLLLDTTRFLFICASFPDKGPFSPTPAIDSAWHEFLMFTDEYQRFCQKYLGRFVHHRPFVPGVVVKPGGIYRTYVIARQMLGDDLSPNWMLPDVEFKSLDAMSECGGSCGGGCNGGNCWS